MPAARGIVRANSLNAGKLKEPHPFYAEPEVPVIFVLISNETSVESS